MRVWKEWARGKSARIERTRWVNPGRNTDHPSAKELPVYCIRAVGAA